MPEFTITPEIISMVAGTLLSLLFSYLWGVREWYAALSEDKKKAIMAAALLVVVIAIAVLSCTGVWPLVACTKVGLFELVSMFIAALIANQSTYQITIKTNSVKAVRAAKEMEGLRAQAVG